MIELLEEGVYPAEDEVSGFASAPEIPPTFDDSFVVPEDLKTSARTSNPGDHPDEEFEAECFCPTDVTEAIERLPSRDETPSSPLLTNNDGNANA